MSRPPSIRRLFRLAPRRPVDADAEVDDEIRFHLEARTEQLVAGGLARDAARAEALRRFGDMEAARGRLRHGAQRRRARMLRRERLEAVWQDVSFALRQMRRSPGFTAAVVATFALAIAANATMFGIVDRLLLRPPAYLADPGSTHRVYLVRRLPDGEERVDNNISYRRYTELREHGRAFSSAAAFYATDMVVGTGEEARELRTGLVSASFWQLFDARPVIGRFFGEAEDRVPAGEPVAVLSYGFWQSRFAGSQDVLGQTIRIGGKTYTIIGVAPKGFTGVSLEPLIAFVPITAAADDMFGAFRSPWHSGHNLSWLEMVVRRSPGVSAEAAQADLTGAYRRSWTASPGARPVEEARPHALLASVLFDRGPKQRDDAKVATWLGGVAVIVLLIACANVANLLLARARRRGREIAVRIALGVGRARLVGQLITESVLLGLLGGIAGLGLAQVGGGVLRVLLLPDLDWSAGLLDRRLLLATAGAALAAGLLAGLAPALQAGRGDVAGALKAGGREGSVRRSRTRAALLVLQVALSVVLLVGAGLFARSLYNVRTVEMGFDPERVLYASVDLRGTRLTPAESMALTRRLLDRARELPQVEHAALTRSVPFWMTWSEDIAVPGIDSVSRLGDFSANAVSADYFATMGTRLLRGRPIGDEDREGTQRVVVVNEAMARTIWKETDALGQCLKVGGMEPRTPGGSAGADAAPCSIVVGIAESIRRGSFDTPAMEYYMAMDQRRDVRDAGMFIRTRGESRRQLEAVRQELQRLVPGAAFVSARSLQDVVDPNLRPWRLGATMFSVFGALALVLAAVGLYGVIAFNVTQRIHELGVRVALGARTPDILRLVIGEGMRLAVLGVVLGLGAALVAGRYVATLLFKVSPTDAATFVIVGAALLVVAVAASFAPALRAARVPPNVALRAE